MVQNLQRLPLDASINWLYLHQDTGKTYSEISKMRSYWKYSKANTCRHMKNNIGDLVVTKEQSGKTTKTICLLKESYLTTNQAFARRDGGNFWVKRVMVKAGIPLSIGEETGCRVLQKAGLKLTHAQRKRIMTKNDLKLRLKFTRKVCRKRAMRGYGI